MDYQIKKSEQVETYLRHLYDNLDEGFNSQLFEAFEKACEKILQNPTSPDFLKNNLEDYRAVDVLAQKRAFFKIYSDYSVIFIAWLNLDEFPHDSSKGEYDLCYREFQNLLRNGKLEKYIPEKIEEPEFKFNGKFRKDKNIFTFLKTTQSHSQAQLKLVPRSPNEYEIEHIHESDYYSDSLPLLLERVVAEAKKEKIDLVTFVGIERDYDYRMSVIQALSSAGFQQHSNDDDGVLFKSAA